MFSHDVEMNNKGILQFYIFTRDHTNATSSIKTVTPVLVTSATSDDASAEQAITNIRMYHTRDLWQADGGIYYLSQSM